MPPPSGCFAAMSTNAAGSRSSANDACARAARRARRSNGESQCSMSASTTLRIHVSYRRVSVDAEEATPIGSFSSDRLVRPSESSASTPSPARARSEASPGIHVRRSSTEGGARPASVEERADARARSSASFSASSWSRDAAGASGARYSRSSGDRKASPRDTRSAARDALAARTSRASSTAARVVSADASHMSPESRRSTAAASAWSEGSTTAPISDSTSCRLSS